MDIDANHRTRRVMILAGLGVGAVIVVVLAAMTWLFARPGTVSSRTTVTPSSSIRTTVTPSISGPSGSPSISGPSGSPSGSGSGGSPSGSGRIAATELAGHWDSTIGVRVTFAPDGTWSTIGGCNSGTGTWRSTVDGRLTVTITSRTRLPCPLTAGSDGVPAGDMMLSYLQATTRVQTGTVSGRPQLTLIDRQGGQLVRLLRQTDTTGPTAGSAPALRARAASGSCPTCSA
jgi:hypothetical protein